MMSVNERYGLPRDLAIGSNTAGEHPSSATRPIHYPEWSTPSDRGTGYYVGSHMINEAPPQRRRFRIAMMGAGAAGIDFLHHIAAGALADLPGGVDVVCFEKNADVGGTWFENRYPGCACDVPSASYSFSWKDNVEWTSYYSGAKEIWKYMKDIVEEEGLAKWIIFNTRVVRAQWSEDKGSWNIHLQTGEGDGSRQWQEECDVFLNGTGFLNAWKWPDIPGLDSFEGKLFHTAKFDEGYDMEGKRVAVIGSGSSGVQTVASIYEHVSELHTWVRTPTWITAGFAQKYAGPDGKNFDYTEEQKANWRSNPESYQEYRKKIELELNGRFKLILRNSQESDEANAFAYREMTTKLASNPALIEHMIPKNFNVACRRPTPGNGYLEALTGQKTTVYTEALAAITPRGFRNASGTEVEVDVIICATGFDTSFRPRFPVLGLGGASLAEEWKTLPRSYISIAAPKMPNYFMYSGPFTPVAQGSILPLLTLFTKHFLQIIRKMQRQHIKRIVPKQSAIEDFMEHAQTYLRRTCWSDPCTSWFKQGTKHGPVVMWCGSRLGFFDLMEEVNFEDYDIEYWSGNRWGWLGSGFSMHEFDGSDTTYYLNREWQDAAEKKVGPTMKKARVNGVTTAGARNGGPSNGVSSVTVENVRHGNVAGTDGVNDDETKQDRMLVAEAPSAMPINSRAVLDTNEW